MRIWVGGLEVHRDLGADGPRVGPGLGQAHREPVVVGAAPAVDGGRALEVPRHEVEVPVPIQVGEDEAPSVAGGVEAPLGGGLDEGVSLVDVVAPALDHGVLGGPAADGAVVVHEVDAGFRRDVGEDDIRR